MMSIFRSFDVPKRDALLPPLALAGTLAVVLVTMVNGCGGGGGGGGNGSPSTPTPIDTTTPTPGSTPTPTPTPILNNGQATLAILWPGRFRSVTAPTAAESVTVTITRIDTGAVVAQRTIVRPSGINNSSDTFTGLPQTTLNVVTSAHPQADGTGTVLATGGAQLALSNSTPYLDLSFSLASTIDHLTATPSASQVAVGAQGTLMISAYDSTGAVVLIRPETLMVSSAARSVAQILDYSVLPMTFYASSGGSTSFSVTETESGKSALAPLKVGFPYRATVANTGTRGPIPFTVDMPDDGYTFERFSGDTYSWTDFQSTAAEVASDGAAVSLQVPATYGDRQFVSWTLDGNAGPTTPMLTLDPKAGATAQISAGYTPRQPAADGSFSPNYFGQVDNSTGLVDVATQWDRSGPVKVAFVTTDGYTDAREQQAIAGLQYWTSATNGVVQFTILPNNDTTDADVIIGFTTPDAPNPSPKTYIPNADFPVPLTTSSAVLGQTFWLDDPTTHIGFTKRVILIYYQRISQDLQLRSVTAHEMGHALGSDGHSNDERNLMYYATRTYMYSGSGSSHNTVANAYLWEEDLNMVMTLYQQGGYDVTTRSVRKRLTVPKTHGTLRTHAIP